MIFYIKNKKKMNDDLGYNMDKIGNYEESEVQKIKLLPSVVLFIKQFAILWKKLKLHD